MNVYTSLPVYTGDVSGVCSALYELGGMIVIHDPSGCNSTYNTHDEIRWYDHPSLIFISGLKESDAIMGNDQKFIDDIIASANDLQPRFIALVNSPVPYINGTDMEAICHQVSEKTGIPAFYVPTNALHDYAHGISLAFTSLAKAFTFKRGEKIPHSLNILGVTPLDYTDATCVSSMKQVLSAFKVVSVWAKEASLEELEKSLLAQVNLVVSSSGLALAKYLYKNYGMPYVIGVPLEALQETITTLLEKAIATGENQSIINSIHGDKKVTLIGEPILAHSLGTVLTRDYALDYRVLCDLEDHKGLLRKEDLACHDEKHMQAYLQDSPYVIADPLYRKIVSTKLIALPHLAMSGRLFLKDIEDVITMKVGGMCDEFK